VAILATRDGPSLTYLGTGREFPMARPDPLPAGHPTDRLLGRSLAISALRAQIRHLAAFDTVGSPHAPTVLLQGETGTGKGLVARVIHDSGPRAQGPFIDVNCAAIPETLLEAELLGFEAGTFTDAKRAKPGLLEAASGGTLFLDEIEALPLALQSKFLKVIEEKWVRRLGAVRGRPVDVKVIAATTADLGGYAAQGRFRADLYHRLAVVVVTLPPLRERTDDIIVLAEQLLGRYAEAHGVSPKRLSGAAEAWLLGYQWPGNVRELSHLLERVTLLGREAILSASTLESLCLPQPPSLAQAEPRSGADHQVPRDERAQIQAVLGQTRGNVVQAARLLGLSRGSLRHRMRRYGLKSPKGREPAPGTSGDQHATLPETSGAELAPESPVALSPGWEQKPVAVLAIELTFPTAREGEAAGYEPWTAESRWEQALVEKVQGFGGAVLQRSPSLLLVAFGIPQTLEQLPQRAVQAALALRHLIAEGAEGEPRPELRLVGHWGRLLVDVQATDPAAQLRAIGQTLAWPVRLLGQAAPGDILLSPEMGQLVERWCEVQAWEVSLQGRQPGRIRVYAVVGNRPPWSRLVRQGLRPLSPFVGRDQELATLGERLLQVEGSRGQVVAVIGEPGVGKSRVCYEFIRGALAPPWLILETQGTGYGKATPYLPVIDLLRAYFRIEDRDDLPTIQEKVTAKLCSLDDTLKPTAPAFLMLLDVPVEDSQWQALKAPQRRQRTLDAVKRLLLRECQAQPLLLVVENLHWIDAETQAVLDTLIESLPTARIFLLTTYRPEYHHGWGSKTSYTQLRLEPLPRESTQELLDALLGDDAALEPLKQRLSERTQGNPFFLEESVRTLVETQVLVGERGAYRQAKPLHSMQVPAAVQAVLVARIDRLPPEDKRLLQTAAVIGAEVPFALLQAIADSTEEVLRRALTHLQAAEFLYETHLFPELKYTFKHAFTHEVAYSSLPQERCRALHARLVEALEVIAGDRVAEQVERLAHHALRGEVWVKALAYSRQAGQKAMARSAYREAAESFEQALRALRHLPQQRGTLEQAIDLRFALRSALRPLGDFGRILAALREAEALAEALDDPRRLAQVSVFLSRHFSLLGAYDQAITSAQRALALATASGDVILPPLANYYLGLAYQAQGDYRRAIACLGQTVASLEGARRHERFGQLFLPAMLSRGALARCHAELGAFAAGRALAEEGLQIAEAVTHPASLMIAYRQAGLLFLRQGDLPRALPRLERAMSLCQNADSPGYFPRVAAALGAAYTLGGRIADAVPLLTQAMEQMTATERVDFQTLCGLSLGEAQALAGRLEEAHTLAERALALARKDQERGHQAYALHLLGEIAARRDPPEVDKAEALYRQALALAEELGMRPLQAHCHLGLGKLYGKIGRWEEARTQLAAAIELYWAMEMTFWLPGAEAALAHISG
jgi:DNA-binding NtrC family response regulator/predicted ATPase